jgi:hypothetical protein
MVAVFGDLKCALQKAIRRYDQELYMLVGLEYLHSRPWSINTGWERLNVIANEDVRIFGLRKSVKRLHASAHPARKNGNLIYMEEEYAPYVFLSPTLFEPMGDETVCAMVQKR